MSEELKERIRIAMSDQATGDELIAIIQSGSTAGVAVADNTTANATDLASAEALANANKSKINELLASLRGAGVIA